MSRTPIRSVYKTSQNATPPSATWQSSLKGSYRQRRMPGRSSDVVSNFPMPHSRITYGPGEVLEQISSVTTPEVSLGSSESDQFDSFSTNSSLENDLIGASGSYMALNRLIELVEEQSKRVDIVLRNQEEIKCEQDAIYGELEELKKNCSNSTLLFGKSGNKKRLVTRKLTDQVNAVYESITEKFKPDESSTSNENKIVTRKLIEEIKLVNQENEEHSDSIIKLAVKRKYESERRLFNENQKGDDIKIDRLKKAKYEQRKQRAYDRRKSVITKKEEKYFDVMTKDYMSEESDCTDPEYIITHKHPWRSEKLNTWFLELDQRYQKRQKKAKCITPSKKRKIGHPANSSPPNGAPSWAVDSEWKKNNVLAEEDKADQSTDNVEQEEEITEFTFDD